MKKLKNVVIDYCSNSDESEQLIERQKTRLDVLKQKRKEKKIKLQRKT